LPKHEGQATGAQRVVTLPSGQGNPEKVGSAAIGWTLAPCIRVFASLTTSRQGV